MGSGGTTCDACRKPNDECSCLPERVESESPVCPYCGCEFAGMKDYLRFVNCECGMRFEVERKVVYVSRPLL
jgi:hypothetical protein